VKPRTQEVLIMSIGLVGRKCGMTRIFSDSGESIPVTVVQVLPNQISQIKTVELDGYSSIQVTCGEKKRSRVSKSEGGHFAKSGVPVGRGLWEFKLDSVEGYELGQSLSVSLLEEGQIVDVSAVSKGKGFQGGVKRWNFAMQDATHGNSISHRAPGSIGQCQTPGKVWKGKKMAGQMGNKKITTQNLQIVKVDEAEGLILIKGAVPGAAGSDVVVKPAVKVKS